MEISREIVQYLVDRTWAADHGQDSLVPGMCYWCGHEWPCLFEQAKEALRNEIDSKSL